ncbi:MAG: dTDP-4-dehydrorhamnose reductase [Oligoflexia bacterium]|nr:dTDP-4-dehydrorhamnose reductase [Oligoflexia bacterium]
MKILVTGSTGQLGKALVTAFGKQSTLNNQKVEVEVVALTRSEFDLTKPKTVAEVLYKHQPQWVINTAAYTDVARAETEEDLANIVNGDTPRIMAKWCAENNASFISYSTDYVFDGTHTSPATEDLSTNPLNAYGRSKVRGEKLISEIGDKWIIFRTSWVYDESGKNFLRTMLKFGQEREELQVINDQWGAPTYANDLAMGTLDAIIKLNGLKEFSRGIFHMCNEGETTWHGFAQEIFKCAMDKNIPLKVKMVKPVSTKDYKNPVVRPLNSRLDMAKLNKILGVKLRPWDQAVKACMEHLS